jgi:FMN phosphatase YigB (HAD superfamily)
MHEELNLSKYQDKKLIAFDLYGTCINHCPSDFRLSWEIRNFFKTNPISIFDSENEIIEKYWLKIVITEKIKDKVRQDLKTTFVFPDVLETLRYIKSKWYQTAVVSNLWKDYVEPLRRLIPKWNFDYEVLSCDVWVVKPDSRIYEYLKLLSWTDFKDIIMIWDNLKADVMWSNNVWITPIHLNRTEEWIKELHKKWIDFIQISTLTDLKEIL